ncbi:hypothetical protein AC062_1140 [Pasteurellaceae bacterium NI1060]|nr:hypothetical protein AC062_1140 [Pasteurellaceae bacterium NI1060]
MVIACEGMFNVEGDSTVKGNATFEKDTLTKGTNVEGDSLVKGNYG